MILLFPALMTFVFCGLFLFIQKGKFSRTAVFLSLFYFLWGSAMVSLLVATDDAGFFSLYYIAAFALLFFVLLLAIPPTVYLYCCLLLGKQIETVLKHYYSIFILLIINIASFVYLDSDSNSSLSIVNENVLTYSNFIALLFVFPVINIFYIYKSIVLYSEYKRGYKKQTSSRNEVNPNMVLFFIFGYLFFILLLLLDVSNVIPKSLGLSFAIYAVVYFVCVGYYGFRHEMILRKILSDSENISEDQIHSKAFQGIEERLNQILKDEKPYLDSKLTIDQLAKKISTNEKYLSNFLNTNYGMNFSTFINSHRIVDSKELLLSDETSNFTIETIANMAGFHSKSSFNTAFKKATGLTPSEFKKNDMA